MKLTRLAILFVTAFSGAAFCQAPAQIAAQQNEAKTEFFEKKIRPVFVKNCQMCHNAKVKTSGLDLSSGAGFLAGGTSGALISKDSPEKSLLLRLTSYDESLKMPPMGKLKPEELADLATWVKVGAPWPGTDASAVAAPKVVALQFSEEQKTFWAFQPIKKVTPPAAKDGSLIPNEIDQFVFAKLAEKGLKPARRADKLTLLRRATYDLIGLPPTPDEIQAFLADRSPRAFETVVDRLLASPRYGERWGRHWLDVARYADSTGNDEDHRYPYAWRYRDYVIDAFNRDMPYDQFVREQIAGDLIQTDGPGQLNKRGLVATGFLALGAKAIAQQDKQKMLYDVYDEQVDVTSKAFLGMTMACARCHNHKFDPILTKDYYSMVGMFASTKQFEDPSSHVSKLLFTPLAPAGEYKAYQAQQDKLRNLKVLMDEVSSVDGEAHVRKLSGQLADYMVAARRVYEGKEAADVVAAAAGLDAAVLKRWVTYLGEGSKAHPQLADWDNAPAASQAATARKYQERFAKQFADWTTQMDKWRAAARKRIAEGDMPPPDKPQFEAATDLFFYETHIQQGPFHLSDKDRDKVLSPAVQTQVAALKKEMEDLKAHALPQPDMACAVAEGSPVDQKVFLRGDYNSLGEDAPKAFPTILAKPTDAKISSVSGRLELADWIARADNPMTSRVMANRIWQWHFGEGIVRTPDNFGKMGDRPSHPELLDFLATRFVESGWSVKKMHKLIMLSDVYQRSSDVDEKSAEADPENRLLAHFNRQRLDVEAIRDGILAIGGTIDFTMGGSLQSGFGTDGENSSGRLSMDPLKITRRTVYLPLRRANLPTLLNLFDFGDATTVNGRRSLTNVAPQTLFSMNSEFSFDNAKRLADGALAMKDASDAKRLESVYLKVLNRTPEPGEIDSALTYLNQYATKYPGVAPLNSGQVSAWQSLCHILLASNEFVYLD